MKKFFQVPSYTYEDQIVRQKVGKYHVIETAVKEKKKTNE